MMYEFGDAELPWLPQLVDIESFKVNSDDPDYWRRFGWEALEVPVECTFVRGHMDTLKTRFDERYANRMVNAETMERWQIRLQNRFDEVVRRYDRMYELYQRYDSDMKEDILSGDKTVTSSSENSSGSATTEGSDTFSGTDSVTGTATTEGTVRNIDTPDENINNVSGYAGNRSDSTNENSTTSQNTSSSKKDTTASNNYNNNNTVNSTVTRTITGQGVVDSVNDSVMAWRDIDTEFVKEFENLFLNVFWF